MKRNWTLVVIVVASLATSASASAFFAFNRVADTSTPIPGGTGTFTAFDPQVSYASVPGAPFGIAFRGVGAGGQEGIYTGTLDGTVTRVADRGTTVPGTSGTFASFGTPSGDDPIYFQATGAGRTGIYHAAGGAVAVVDDAPVGSSTFGRVAALGTYIAYRRNGIVVANRTGTLGPVFFTPPTGVVVSQFGDPDVGQLGAFRTLAVRVEFFDFLSQRSGVLRHAGGLPDDILFGGPAGTTGEASLNWSGTIAVLQFDGQSVRFESGFGFPPGEIDTSHAIPGGTGNFTSFRAASAGSPNLGLVDTQAVFVGIGSGGQEGIYYVRSGANFSYKLIARGDTLDGRIVDRLDIGRDSEYGVSVAFVATFTDGSSGIYHVTIPEPGGLVIAGMLGGLVLRRRRR